MPKTTGRRLHTSMNTFTWSTKAIDDYNWPRVFFRIYFGGHAGSEGHTTIALASRQQSSAGIYGDYVAMYDLNFTGSQLMHVGIALDKYNPEFIKLYIDGEKKEPVTKISNRDVQLLLNDINAVLSEDTYHLDLNRWPDRQDGVAGQHDSGQYIDNLVIWDYAKTDFSDRFQEEPVLDFDSDSIPDSSDNCKNVANPDQADFDSDGKGDACDDDVDGDGVANASDACALTELNAVVKPAEGCSIDQLCPCDGPRGTISAWKNHGQYVSCVAKSAESFLAAGLITQAEKDAVCSEAGQSVCGGKK